MSEVQSWYEEVAVNLRLTADLVEKIGAERDQLKKELETIRRCYRDAIEVVDEVFQSTCDAEPILPDFLLPGDSKFQGVKKLAIAYRDANSELSKLQVEREPVDNGDGTETKLLPVTYPKGMDVVEVRRFRKGDWFATGMGKAVEATSTDTCPAAAWLILRPDPKPPEPVTWEAPLVDGMWMAEETRIHDGCRGFGWAGSAGSIRGLSKPAKLGRYRFENGVGTLIEEAK